MRRSALVFGISVAASAFALAVERDAAACGGCFHPPTQTVSDITDERMLLAVSPTQTTLYDQLEYVGSPTSFAWVLPIHGTVTVGLSADVLFSTLDTLTQTTVEQPAAAWSNPPVGESRQEPSENPKRLSQESRGRNFRRTGTGTRKGVGKGTPGNWKRNPQGDRGKNPQGNWKRLPQGNRGKDLKRESETRLAEAVGKPGANGWNPGKLLQRECDNGRGMGSAGSARGYRTILKWHSAVTWKPNQVFDSA